MSTAGATGLIGTAVGLAVLVGVAGLAFRAVEKSLFIILPPELDFFFFPINVSPSLSLFKILVKAISPSYSDQKYSQIYFFA